jgi:hypothetical protein
MPVVIKLVRFHMQTLRTSHAIVCEVLSSMLTREVDFLWLRSYTPDVGARSVLLCLHMPPSSTSSFMPRVNWVTTSWLFVEQFVEFTMHLNNVFTLRELQHAKKSLSRCRHLPLYEKQRRCVALTGTFRWAYTF